ncbi:MAG: hypothetical protein RR224_02495 [Clostridia bacterium]
MLRSVLQPSRFMGKKSTISLEKKGARPPGPPKSDDEVDELERLCRENERLKRQLEESKMLAELLKKGRNSKGEDAGKATR